MNNKYKMESRVNVKIQNYINQLKQDCVKKINEHSGFDTLTQYIIDYPMFTLDIQDLQKRKRVRNAVPICERCLANRINNTQCTRRKQSGYDFCGTHIKGQPYGVIETNAEPINPSIKNIDIRNEEINGIHYYIDNNNNVYNTEDILSNKPNPTIITKYTNINSINNVL
jgi:hypothetical protein